MNCKNCGGRLTGKDRFCPACGARAVKQDVPTDPAQPNAEYLTVYRTYLEKMNRAYTLMLIIGIYEIIVGIPLLGAIGYGFICIPLGIWNVSYSINMRKLIADIPQHPEYLDGLLGEEGWGTEQLRRILCIIFGAGLGILLAIIYKKSIDYGFANRGMILNARNHLCKGKA